MICPICNSKTTTTTYVGKIRSGAPGCSTDKDTCVYKCEHCFVIWHNNETGDFLYQNNEYRESMGETVTLSEFYHKHDSEIIDKLNYTGTTVYRDKLLMDIGSGGGGFADYIRGVTSDVVLIEPNNSFAEQLREKGYKVYSYSEDALEKYASRVEIITSFDVIEHVADPQMFLQTVYDLLTQGGIAYIGTPTEYPVLRSLLGSQFDCFLFSTQHPWVFSSKSLSIMANKCGFSRFGIKFYQRFGIGNLLAWLQTRQPKGDIRFDFISPQMDAYYKSEMAREETAEYLVLELTK